MATEVIVEIKITNRERPDPGYAASWEALRRQMSYDFKLARSTADPESLLASLVRAAQYTA